VVVDDLLDRGLDRFVIIHVELDEPHFGAFAAPGCLPAGADYNAVLTGELSVKRPERKTKVMCSLITASPNAGPYTHWTAAAHATTRPSRVTPAPALPLTTRSARNFPSLGAPQLRLAPAGREPPAW
jgi:hypothetical protein